jgi:hypothetical protein
MRRVGWAYLKAVRYYLSAADSGEKALSLIAVLLRGIWLDDIDTRTQKTTPTALAEHILRAIYLLISSQTVDIAPKWNLY